MYYITCVIINYLILLFKLLHLSLFENSADNGLATHTYKRKK